jgi:putative transposase
MTLFQKQFRVESARRVGRDYGARGWYFVTICTRSRRHSLGKIVDGKIVLSRAGVIAERQIRQTEAHYSNVSIDRFVIMPNHVHAIVVIEGFHEYSPLEARNLENQDATGKRRAQGLSNVVGGYKAGVSRVCWTEGIPDFAWQERFHDHILRSNASVNAVRDYICRNPQNWIADPYRIA